MAERERPPPVCNLKLLKLNLRSLATRAALAEMMWHGCYEHGHKSACEGIVDARAAVDEMADMIIRELGDCLEAR